MEFNKPQVWYEQVTVSKPMVSERDTQAKERRVYPSEVSACKSSYIPRRSILIASCPTQARERLTSYRGRMMVKICWQVNDGPVEVEMRDCGLLPIMVRVGLVYVLANVRSSLMIPCAR